MDISHVWHSAGAMVGLDRYHLSFGVCLAADKKMAGFSSVMFIAL